MTKEQKFYKALQDVFIGAKIEGTGGFVNLMRIKSNYYQKIEDILKNDIESALRSYSEFRDELFDKLYSFFSRYFTESGSIYFNSTPFHNNIYEKVYTDEKDVILFWKTQMLYYVKTDRIFRSMPVEFDGFKFYFDASKIENKKANEKRSLVFELDKVKEDDTIVFAVQYSEKGTKTKQDDILKAIKRKGIAITEEQLERAFRIFEKQSEVDFFINKNAKAFLQEQFKLWSYQYFWEGAKEWGADRVNQLQILKDIAFKIIDFISQFEDELVKIWNKPKFVKNSNYVITLDRIKDEKLIKKILKHKNITKQIKEWQDLGIVDENFKTTDIFEIDITGKHLSDKYKHLPIDTKYFKDVEFEILSLFDDLDNALDGWLIKSENYQALNTILPKFKEKVQTIYIDPPYNTGSDEFIYKDKFQHSSWLTMMENRLDLAKDFLKREGNIFVSIDENQKNSLYFLMIEKFIYFKELIWESGAPLRFKATTTIWPRIHETVFHFTKSENNLYFPTSTLKKWKTGEPILTGSIIKIDEHKIYSSDYVIGAKENTGFGTGQKPEKLMKLLFDASIDYSKQKGNIIMDFFIGSGTTTAVAHKLGLKWIGVELGEHFSELFVKKVDRYGREIEKEIGCLGRMKIVLSGKGIKIEPTMLSREVNWQGGGFFKYYELEQYEEALANCKYEDGDLFNVPGRSPYQEYVFLKDEKMLKALEIDYENNKVKVDLNRLYPNIDIAETLSNLTGKWIKKISNREVEFEDGTKINTKDLDYKLIKSLIWW